MAAPPANAFFSPWEPAPGFTPRPGDDDLAKRIEKLAEFVHKNGPGFQQLMKDKQAQNPEFAFLFGGEGGAYYRWRLHCSLYNIPADQPPPAAPWEAPVPQARPPTPPRTLDLYEQLSPEIQTGFSQVLDALNGSKESIKSAQAWFVQCGEACAPGLAEAMLARIREPTRGFDEQLYVIYLANDILFKGLRERNIPSELDFLARAFHPVIGEMLSTALRTAGHTAQAAERLKKIVQFWGAKGVYEQGVIADLDRRTAELPPGGAANHAGIPPPGVALPAGAPVVPGGPGGVTGPGGGYPPQGYAPPPGHHAPPPGYGHPGYGAPPPPGWGAPPPVPPPGYAPPPPHPGYGAPPPPGAYPAPGYGAPPPSFPSHPNAPVAPAVPPPSAQPAGFPPGLIPQLVRQHQRDSPLYSPLNPLDIQHLGLPPSEPVDDYLEGRLERFYAELKGGSRARERLEETRLREREEIRRSSSGGGGGGARHGHMDVDSDTNTYRDGVAAGGGLARGGLGAAAVHGNPRELTAGDDLYSAYRKIKGGAYQLMMSEQQQREAAVAAARR